MKGTENLRPEVLAFAKAMESRLRANDHKEGWPTLSMGQVFKRMREEMEEMATAALMQEGGVLLEAADLANFAMFGALLAGELKT